MSYQNGAIRDCNDDCKNCGRAKYCGEAYIDPDEQNEKKTKENVQETVNPAKEQESEKKEKYSQPNFLDLL